MLKRTSQQHEDQWLALLELSGTPRQDLNSSPAEIVLGRSTRTVIPMHAKECVNFAFDCHSKRRNVVKCSYDKCRPTQTTFCLPIEKQLPKQTSLLAKMQMVLTHLIIL